MSEDSRNLRTTELSEEQVKAIYQKECKETQKALSEAGVTPDTPRDLEFSLLESSRQKNR